MGPEQPNTYWRRRAAVLVALLVVVWLAWWLLDAAFGSGDQPASEPSASPSVGLTVSPTPVPVPSASVSGAALPLAASSAASPSLARCSSSAVAVAARPASRTTGVGQGIEVTMSVTNTGEDPCRRDVGSGANEILITSGSVLVWSSDFCSASDARDRVLLEPGTPVTAAATWPGKVTGPDCPAGQPVAQAGTYRVVARNGGVESEPVTFTVQ